MKFWVYLIISAHKNKIYSYVGYTKNLKSRLLLHNNSKGAKYTRGKKWSLAYKKSYDTKGKALKNEFKLKKNKKKRKVIKDKYLIKNENINSSTL